jgi:hypothetical protein
LLAVFLEEPLPCAGAKRSGRPILKIWGFTLFIRSYLKYGGEGGRNFFDLLKLVEGECILDVGGLPGFWKEARLPGIKINCLNMDIKAVEGWQHQRESISMLEGVG